MIPSASLTSKDLSNLGLNILKNKSQKISIKQNLIVLIDAWTDRVSKVEVLMELRIKNLLLRTRMISLSFLRRIMRKEGVDDLKSKRITKGKRDRDGHKVI